MAIATVTRDVYLTLSTNTAEDFLDFVTNGIINNLGFTLVSSSNNTLIQNFNGGESDSSGKQRIFSYAYNNSSKGTLFFELSYGSTDNLGRKLFIFQIDNSSFLLGNSVDKGRKFVTNTLSFTSGEPIIVHYFNHSEIKAVTFSQGYTGATLSFCIIRPSIKPTWWSDSLSLYSFLYTPFYNPINSFLADSTVFSLSLSSASNTYLSTLQDCYFSIAYNSGSSFVTSNPINGLRSMLGGFHLITNESEGNRGGVVGTVSSDLALVNATGLNINSIIQVQASTARYQTLAKSDNNPVLAVKIVN